MPGILPLVALVAAMACCSASTAVGALAAPSPWLRSLPNTTVRGFPIWISPGVITPSYKNMLLAQDESADHRLFAFDQQSGGALWSVHLPGPMLPVAIRGGPQGEGAILVMAGNVVLALTTLGKGGRVWTSQPLAAPAFPPIVAPCGVVVTASGNQLVGLHIINGKTAWSHENGAYPPLCPLPSGLDRPYELLSDETIVACVVSNGTGRSYLTRYSACSGVPLEEPPVFTDWGVMMSPATTLVVPSNFVHAPPINSGLAVTVALVVPATTSAPARYAVATALFPVAARGGSGLAAEGRLASSGSGSDSPTADFYEFPQAGVLTFLLADEQDPGVVVAGNYDAFVAAFSVGNFSGGPKWNVTLPQSLPPGSRAGHSSSDHSAVHGVGSSGAPAALAPATHVAMNNGVVTVLQPVLLSSGQPSTSSYTTAITVARAVQLGWTMNVGQPVGSPRLTTGYTHGGTPGGWVAMYMPTGGSGTGAGVYGFNVSADGSQVFHFPTGPYPPASVSVGLTGSGTLFVTFAAATTVFWVPLPSPI